MKRRRRPHGASKTRPPSASLFSSLFPSKVVVLCPIVRKWGKEITRFFSFPPFFFFQHGWMLGHRPGDILSRRQFQILLSARDLPFLLPPLFFPPLFFFFFFSFCWILMRFFEYIDRPCRLSLLGAGRKGKAGR